MAELEKEILQKITTGNQCEVINQYGNYFMDLCERASRYLDGSREENTNNIFDWLANGGEFTESFFNAETLANQYKSYWEM